MKLLFCDECGDVIVLKKEPGSCKCGHSSGRYLQDELHAVYTGGIPLALNNNSLKFTLDNYHKIGHGFSLDAWSVNPDEEEYTKVSREEYISMSHNYSGYCITVPDGYELRHFVAEHFPDREDYMGEIIEWMPKDMDPVKWYGKYKDRKDVIFSTGFHMIEKMKLYICYGCDKRCHIDSNENIIVGPEECPFEFAPVDPTKPVCNEEGGDHFFCTLQKDHEGDHEAWWHHGMPDQKLMFKWKRS